MSHLPKHDPLPKGPAPLPGLVTVGVTLLQADSDWGKAQPGGLSALLRRLLAQERKRQERRADPQPSQK